MVDYKGVTLSHFVQATPSVLKKIVAVCQVITILSICAINDVKIKDNEYSDCKGTGELM